MVGDDKYLDQDYLIDLEMFPGFYVPETKIPLRSIIIIIVKLGSRSKVYLKSQIRDLDLELVAIIAMSPTTTMKLF